MEIHPAVGAAAEGLERFLGTSVQANAYASWTDREGFGLHWDDHDVVVIQVHGSKRWRLYGSTREAPTFRDVESPERPEGGPVADIVLSPGDVLYLPRGWWHAVTADQGTEPLHLTFGMVPHTGADLMPVAWFYRSVCTPMGHFVREAVWAPAERAAVETARAGREAWRTARGTVRRARRDAWRALVGGPGPVEVREPAGVLARTLGSTTTVPSAAPEPEISLPGGQTAQRG